MGAIPTFLTNLTSSTPAKHTAYYYQGYGNFEEKVCNGS
jgi:hypothetical protein